MTPKFLALFFASYAALVAARVPNRYIVELDTEPVAEHVARLPLRARLQAPAAAAHRARLDNEQRTARARLSRTRARILDSVTTVANALFVEIPDEDAAQLAALPGVKRVHPVRTYHMVMDRAVLVHRVADAWNLIGYENAGAGVKVAIIDSGIQTDHPGLADSALRAPAGYPKTSSDADLASTSGKVIVARSYVNLLPRRDPDQTARDHVGHGTALAMIVAGARVAGTRATIAGIAPKAYLGNYKVFGSPNVNDGSTDDAIIKAVDDAVSDGMDIINLSLGSDIAPRLEDDFTVAAVERAAKAGVIVVAAAGNNGSDLNTLSSPATAPSVIAVGAVTNDRIFASGVESGGVFRQAIAGDNSSAAVPVTAQLADVAAIGNDGRACTDLPASSLSGKIALILRGGCTFETKLNNAQRAGAIAALVYAAADSPAPIAMGTGSATLPAEMVSYEDGAALKEQASHQAVIVTLRFSVSAAPWPAGRMTDFSAAGPNVDTGIKPDLMAAGANIYTATQTLDPAGDMFSSTGFILVDGTSFSAPIVAGAAALIKSARPGLTADQYRSLLINTSAEAFAEAGEGSSVQQTGAGMLNAEAALQATVAASPVSISLGGGSPDLNTTRNLTISNLGTQAEAFEVAAEPRRGVSIVLPVDPVNVPAGGTAQLALQWSGSGLPSGAHEGFLVIRGTSTGTTIRVPYWYDVLSAEPARITVLDAIQRGRRASLQEDAVLLRITDLPGLPVAGLLPEVTALTGDGSVVRIDSYDSEVPGLIGLTLRLGPIPGPNVFKIAAGGVSKEISITAQ